MAHVRTQLRNAVIARLKTVSSVAIACSRLRLTRQVQGDEFPIAAVAVTEAGSPVGRGAPGQRPVRRDFSVRVQLATELAEGADDLLDAIAVDVEKALADPSGLGVGSLTDWAYVGTGDIDGDAAEAGLAVIALNWRCAMTTLDSDPETNLHP